MLLNQYLQNNDSVQLKLGCKFKMYKTRFNFELKWIFLCHLDSIDHNVWKRNFSSDFHTLAHLHISVILVLKYELQGICTCNSAIHKAAGLAVPGRSMILPGTIPETPISCEWSQQLERPLGVIPTTSQRLCE